MKQTPAERNNRRAINKLTREQQADLDSGNRPAKVRQLRRPIDDTDVPSDLYRSPRGRRVEKPGKTHD